MQVQIIMSQVTVYQAKRIPEGVPEEREHQVAVKIHVMKLLLMFLMMMITMIIKE